jgi:hypothetical protein
VTKGMTKGTGRFGAEKYRKIYFKIQKKDDIFQ